MLLPLGLFAFLTWAHGFSRIISSLTMSCQSPYVLDLSKASVQWNENGPLDEAKELLPRAIIVNCISSHVTYWRLESDSGPKMSDEFEQN